MVMVTHFHLLPLSNWTKNYRLWKQDLWEFSKILINFCRKSFVECVSNLWFEIFFVFILFSLLFCFLFYFSFLFRSRSLLPRLSPNVSSLSKSTIYSTLLFYFLFFCRSFIFTASLIHYKATNCLEWPVRWSKKCIKIALRCTYRAPGYQIYISAFKDPHIGISSLCYNHSCSRPRTMNTQSFWNAFFLYLFFFSTLFSSDQITSFKA